MRQKMLVVSAHYGDFIWGCGGSIAKYAGENHEVNVIVLSSGIGSEIKTTGPQSEHSEKALKEKSWRRCEKAAQILGVSNMEYWDMEETPLRMDSEKLELLATRIRQLRPDFILTHDKEQDRLNQDHTSTANALRTSYTIASGAGAYCMGHPVAPRQTPMFGFEPLLHDYTRFTPNLYIDISAFISKKELAMEAFDFNQLITAAYTTKAIERALEYKYWTGAEECDYAEAFSMWGAVCMHGGFVW
jgi:4-oxalomesaconate hydratase